MTDYADCLKKAKVLHKQLLVLDELVMTIEDDSADLMSLRTLMPRLVAKSDRYVLQLQNRQRVSRQMRNMRSKGKLKGTT